MVHYQSTMTDNMDTTPMYFLSQQDHQNSSTSGFNYIILQNDRLHFLLEEKSNRVNQLESDYENLEEEVGQHEVRNNRLKDLLKNFNQIHKWNAEIAYRYKLMHESTILGMETYKKKRFEHLYWLRIICFVVFCVIAQLTNNHLMSFLWGFFLAGAVAYDTFNIHQIHIPLFPEHEKHLGTIKSKIEKTEAAQDYIHEFIEEI